MNFYSIGNSYMPAFALCAGLLAAALPMYCQSEALELDRSKSKKALAKKIRRDSLLIMCIAAGLLILGVIFMLISSIWVH
jgi:hypothetical protein